MEGELLPLHQGIGDNAECFGLGGSKTVPDGGEGLVDPGFGEAEGAGGGEQLAAEGADGVADHPGGSTGKEVLRQENGEELVLGDLEGGKGKTALGVVIAFAVGIVIQRRAEPVTHEIDSALGGLGGDFETAGEAIGIGKGSATNFTIKPVITFEFEMVSHADSTETPPCHPAFFVVAHALLSAKIQVPKNQHKKTARSSSTMAASDAAMCGRQDHPQLLGNHNN